MSSKRPANFIYLARSIEPVIPLVRNDRMKKTRSDWKQVSSIVRSRRERHDGGVTKRMQPSFEITLFFKPYRLLQFPKWHFMAFWQLLFKVQWLTATGFLGLITQSAFSFKKLSRFGGHEFFMFLKAIKNRPLKRPACKKFYKTTAILPEFDYFTRIWLLPFLCQKLSSTVVHFRRSKLSGLFHTD